MKTTEERIVIVKEQWLDAHRQRFSAYFDKVLDYAGTESPIERLLMATLLSFGWRCATSTDSGIDLYVAHYGVNPQAAFVLNNRSILVPQLDETTGGRSIRIDFAFILLQEKLAVEVDGHDFHERTKEQAERDRSRDRAMIADGWTVLRFTGREVFRNPIEGVIEIHAALERLYAEESSQMSRPCP